MSTATVVIKTQSRTIPLEGKADFRSAVIRIRNAAAAGAIFTGRRVEKSALKLVPVRKVFKGGRRGRPRLRSSAEAISEINEYLAAFPTQPSTNLRTTRGQAYNLLLSTKVATSRNRANSFRATGVNVFDESGTFVGPKPRIGPGSTQSARSVQVIETAPYYLKPGQKGFVSGDASRNFRPASISATLTAGEYGLSGEGLYQLHGRKGGGGIGPGVRAGQGTTEGGPLTYVDKQGAGRQELGGALRDSIALITSDLGTLIGVEIQAGGEHAPYAKYVEFGTRHAPAQPFLRPALAQHSEQLVPDIISALERIGMVVEKGR